MQNVKATGFIQQNTTKNSLKQHKRKDDKGMMKDD